MTRRSRCALLDPVEKPVRTHPEPSVVRLSKEMGITREDFFRSLPGVIARRNHELLPDGVSILEGNRRSIVIKVASAGSRVLGTLELPVLRVSFAFTGYTTDEVEGFLAGFDRTLHRGGG
jgi:hypothetical protein